MAGPVHAPVSVARFSALRAFIGSLALHGIVSAVLLGHKTSPPSIPKQEPIELSVVQAGPPPSVVEPPPPEPVQMARPRPPILVKPADRPPPVVALKAPPPLVPLAAAVPAPSKPIFGVSPESVVNDPNAVTVPVGNTVGTSPGLAEPTPTSAPVATSALSGTPGGTGSTPFAPVSERFVQQLPRTIEEVQAPYPEEARRVDMGGTVRLRVGIDENGRVREVKVLKRLGYGLDEAATKALWKFRFSPAVGQDGRPVPFRINYNYTFNPPS